MRFFKKIVCILQFIIPLFIAQVYAEDTDKFAPFKILPWQVGQYAVYQVVSIENDSLDNRYKFSLIGKEELKNETYFWMEIEISEGPYKKINAVVRALIPALTSTEFQENPAEYIANGLFPFRAKRVMMELEEGGFYEQNLATVTSSQVILKDSGYRLGPDSMGRVNFAKLKVDNNLQEVSANSHKLMAFHFYVETDPSEEFNAEGIDLWRCPDVPFLGIVKMEFSKTLYWEKYKRKHTGEVGLEQVFTRIVPGRQRPDTYTINLIDYGTENKN